MSGGEPGWELGEDEARDALALPPRGRYTLFLQSPCGYACGDHETSAFGVLMAVLGILDRVNDFVPESASVWRVEVR